MEIIEVLCKRFGFTHVDTIHLVQDICLIRFAISNEKVSSPLPSFDVLKLDRVICAQETEKIEIDWVLTKTAQSKRCMLVCLVRPRQLRLRAVLMEHTTNGDASKEVIAPQDHISRAVTDSLHGQESGFKLTVQEQLVSDQEVYTQLLIQVCDVVKRQSFVIDFKKWIQSLRKALNQMGLTPMVVEIADVPLSQVASSFSEWNCFTLYLKMGRRQRSIPGAVVKIVDNHANSTPDHKAIDTLKAVPVADSSQGSKNNVAKSEEKSKSLPETISETLSSSTYDSESNRQLSKNEQQPRRNPGWKGLVQGIAFGLIFGTLPLWHLMSEF
jgi:hypothetical protein